MAIDSVSRITDLLDILRIREALFNELTDRSTVLLEHYVALANSGDAGFWNPEHEPEIQNIRETLNKIKELNL